MDIETVLIAYVQENACLYDKNNINYNNEPFVEVIWHMFALVAQKNKIEPLDGDAAKRRWDSLRCNFIQIHREHENFPCLQSQDAINCFPYYNQMQWLIPFIRKRKKKNRKAAKAPEIVDTSPESSTKSPLPSISSDITKITHLLLNSALDKSIQELIMKPATPNNKMRSEESTSFVSHPEPSDFQAVDVAGPQNVTPASTRMSSSPRPNHPFISQGYQRPPESMGGLNTTNHSLNVSSETHPPSIPPGFTPPIAPIRPPCIIAPPMSVDHGDISFMNSIIFDMQRMTPKTKLLFKSKVFLMLHEQHT